MVASSTTDDWIISLSRLIERSIKHSLINIKVSYNCAFYKLHVLCFNDIKRWTMWVLTAGKHLRNRVTLPSWGNMTLCWIEKSFIFQFHWDNNTLFESFSWEDDVIKHPPSKIAKIYSISLSPYFEFCCEKNEPTMQRWFP